ncbi:alcohol dehydrogenase catalytic domain-containing protein [Streptomyces lasiicapitis]|uniref:alcohol dehydrogenase catalytic domain-containing protein n=1 Tax=Streptomyces lasiicapitis TaxID=1923961 RepID=UPI0036C23D77
MAQQVRGVIARAKGEPVRIETITVPDPGPGEAVVKVQACGVCHTDLHYREGGINDDFPFLLGHEAAGVVESVGEGVTEVAPGDFVILNWRAVCGQCRACKRGRPQYCFATHNAKQKMTLADGTELAPALGIGAFAEKTLVAAGQCTKVDPAASPAAAGLLGCGVMAGLGAAINTADVAAGSSVAVIGCGGVGVSAIQGARLKGAAEIVAVDPVASRREAALRFGATQAVGPDELPDINQRLTAGEGFDYVFEVVGKSATARKAYEATRRGGTLCVVGAGAMDDQVQFNMFELFFDEKRILPSLYGGGDVLQSYERAIALWRAGRVDLEGMITHRVQLAEINEALEQMRSGVALRTCIEI